MPASEPMPVPAIAMKYTRRGDSLTRSSLSEGLDHEVVHLGPELVSALLGDEMNPIREQDDDRLALRVDPERGAGEAQVPDRRGREVLPRGRAPGRRRVPAERPAGAGRELLAAAPLAHQRRGQRALAALPGVEPRLREGHHVVRGGEEARVPGDAAHRVGVRIVHLAPDDAPAPRAGLGGGGAPAQRVRKALALAVAHEEGLAHPERAEAALAAELVEPPPGDRLDERPRGDEVEVA